jgi:hypothetical protein
MGNYGGAGSSVVIEKTSTVQFVRLCGEGVGMLNLSLKLLGYGTSSRGLKELQAKMN